MRRVLPAVVVALAACGPSPEPDVARIPYECESGRTVHASYPSDSVAVVEYDDRTIRMTRAVSASGARYVGEDLEWWTRGTGPDSKGTLFRHDADGTGEIVESCAEAED